MRLNGGRTRLLVGFAISGLLVWFLLRAVDLPALAVTLGRADLRLLPVAIVLYFSGVWTRSLRWRLLLPPGSAPTVTLFEALVVGFTVNNLLPVRMGELVRAYLLARWRGVRYGTTFASLVVERILDGLALSALLLLGLLLAPAPGYLAGVGLAVGAAFGVGATLLALASRRAPGIGALGRLVARRLPVRLGMGVERLALGFAHGLALVRGWRLLLRLALLSLLAWLLELSLFFVLLSSVGLPVSFPLALLGGSAANFATLIPSSPGYVGTFDAALVKVLVDTAGVGTEQAAAYTLLVHATLFLPVVALGLVILWRSDVSFGQVVHARSEAGGDGEGPVGQPAKQTRLPDAG